MAVELELLSRFIQETVRNYKSDALGDVKVPSKTMHRITAASARSYLGISLKGRALVPIR